MLDTQPRTSISPAARERADELWSLILEDPEVSPDDLAPIHAWLFGEVPLARQGRSASASVRAIPQASEAPLVTTQTSRR